MLPKIILFEHMLQAPIVQPFHLLTLTTTFAVRMPAFLCFCLLACALSTLQIFSGVLFLLLFGVIFLSYIVTYLLFSVGKKD